MSHTMFAAQRRDGLFSLERTARELCRLITKFAPVIARLYPENVALQAALSAAMAACEVLRAEVEDQQQPGT